MEENSPPGEVLNEEFVKTRISFVPQHVYVEDISSNDIWKIVFLLVGVFFAFLIPLYRLKHFTMTDVVLMNVPKGNERKEYSFSAFLNNVSEKNVYALLHFQLIPEQDVKHKPATFNIKVSSNHYDSNSKLVKEVENKWVHRFLLNNTYHPLHYSDLRNVSSIIVFTQCIARREWLSMVNIKWEVGQQYPFEISIRINKYIFIVYILVILQWIYFCLKNPMKIRSKLVSIVLPIYLLSHIPFESMSFSYPISQAIRDIIESFSWFFLVIFWRFKSFEFDLGTVFKSDNFKPLMIGSLMSFLRIYYFMGKGLSLMSAPSLADGSDGEEGDFFSRNMYPISLVFTFYLLLIDIIERIDKKEGEELSHYLSDHFMLFFAIGANLYFSLKTMKLKQFIPNPIHMSLIKLLWDMIVIYESIASRPVHEASIENEDAGINPDIELLIDENENQTIE